MPLVPSRCHYCGKEFHRERWLRAKYCSRNCHNQEFSQERIVPPEERFWRFVSKGDDEDCWEWTGTNTKPNRSGYGILVLPRKDGRHVLAHRMSYEMHVGPIPDGLWVLHRCDNPKCVNPSHLFVGTHRDNTDDMLRKGRGAFQRYAWIRRMGQLANGKRQRGENNTMAKLTEDQARRAKYSNESMTKLAREFDVSYSTIHSIRRGKTWAWL